MERPRNGGETPRDTTDRVGDVGSNAGEVDPGVGGEGETIGETPSDTGGAGFGNAVGGGGGGDVPETADEPTG